MKGNYYLSQLQPGTKFYTVGFFGKVKNFYFVGSYLQNLFIQGNKIIERIYIYQKPDSKKTIHTAKNLKVNLF